MNAERPWQDTDDAMLETVHHSYVNDANRHANYAALARELAAAHAECDVQSEAGDLAAHHETMSNHYHAKALQCAAERRRRDEEADSAAEQHDHNTANGC